MRARGPGTVANSCKQEMVHLIPVENMVLCGMETPRMANSGPIRQYAAITRHIDGHITRRSWTLDYREPRYTSVCINLFTPLVLQVRGKGRRMGTIFFYQPWRKSVHPAGSLHKTLTFPDVGRTQAHYDGRQAYSSCALDEPQWYSIVIHVESAKKFRRALGYEFLHASNVSFGSASLI
jgi:hypothetical protein